MENNVYDIQKNYTQVALDWIQEYQGNFSEKNKKELLKLLQQTEQEFIQTIQLLPKETIQDKGNRKLLSMTELKHKLIQDIAIKVIGGTEKIQSLRNMKQLVTYITGGKSEYIAEELVENLNEEQKNIPLPDIQGTVEQIGEVILPPDVLERLESSYLRGKQQAKKRPAGFDKIGLVEQFLSDYLGRERTTFQWKTGTLRSNQMRKISYYHLYLPEINKTLLLNNQYGEGCFLLDGDFDIREAKKYDIKGIEGAIKIHFDYSNSTKFLNKFMEYLPKIIKNNVPNGELYINKIKLRKEKIKEYFDEIGYEKLIKYNQKDIKLIEIWGKKITTIGTQYSFKTQYNLNINTSSGFQEFISFLYEKEFIYTSEKKEEITKEKIKEYFDEIGFDNLIKYTQKQIQSIEIGGYKLKAIATQYGFKTQYKLNITVPIGLQEFIHFLFGKEFKYEEITKEKIKEYFDEIGFENLMKYTVEKIQLIEIGGKKITTIGTQYGFKSQHNLSISKVQGFQEFISYMYNKEFIYEKEKITPKEIKEGFDKLGGYEVLMKYKIDQIIGNSKKNIQALNIKNHKIVTLITQYGFKTQHNLTVITPSGFQEFISYMYNKEFIYEKEKITPKEIKEGFDKLGGYEVLMKYKIDQIVGNSKKNIQALNIKNHKIVTLITQYGFKTQHNLNIQTPIGFQEFISFLYDKKFLYNKQSNNDILRNF